MKTLALAAAIVLLIAGLFAFGYGSAEINGQPVLRAMPLLLGVLCVLAIAYRYYSALPGSEGGDARRSAQNAGA